MGSADARQGFGATPSELSESRIRYGSMCVAAHQVCIRRVDVTPETLPAPARSSAGIAIARNASGPMQAVGGLFAMSADAVKYLF
ncbi:hypothetical protein L2K20_25305, partial [Mycobacterium sp. MBM]|nr:hypothetical protein [Mycobacterium sp. MBM]